MLFVGPLHLRILPHWEAFSPTIQHGSFKHRWKSCQTSNKTSNRIILSKKMYLNSNHPEIIQVEVFSEKKILIPPEFNSEKNLEVSISSAERLAPSTRSKSQLPVATVKLATSVPPPGLSAGGVDQHDHRLGGVFLGI